MEYEHLNLYMNHSLGTWISYIIKFLLERKEVTNPKDKFVEVVEMSCTSTGSKELDMEN